MNHKYIKEMHEKFNASDEIQSLFEKIIELPSNRREDILKDVHVLIEHTGLAYALLSLYRQQVNSGFVLADPLNAKKKEEKKTQVLEERILDVLPSDDDSGEKK